MLVHSSAQQHWGFSLLLCLAFHGMEDLLLMLLLVSKQGLGGLRLGSVVVCAWHVQGIIPGKQKWDRCPGI